MTRTTAHIAPFALALTLCFTAFGDAQALGKVSRNCNPVLSQESITVDWCGDMRLGACGYARYWLYAYSSHFRYDAPTASYILLHTRYSGWAWGELLNIWRAHAGDWPEYLVGGIWGQHWWQDPNTGIVSSLGDTIVTDCNITDWGLQHQIY